MLTTFFTSPYFQQSLAQYLLQIRTKVTTFKHLLASRQLRKCFATALAGSGDRIAVTRNILIKVV